MGIDVDNDEALTAQSNGDEADQHLGELIVYKVEEVLSVNRSILL